MKIFNNGIYFKQTDEKVDGYDTEDDKGNWIHHKYKKPTFWQRTKYFAKYGYEIDLETRLTSYFYFNHDFNDLYMESIVGDAITTAKNLKKKRDFGLSYKYHVEGNTINFETKYAFFQLDFQDNGFQFKLYVNRKSDKKSLESETYTFLNWNNL